MRPIGFVKRITSSTFFTKGKIYPYYRIRSAYTENDYRAEIINDDGDMVPVFLGISTILPDHFEFCYFPEFPENVKDWTEYNWFQYNLKYGS